MLVIVCSQDSIVNMLFIKPTFAQKLLPFCQKKRTETRKHKFQARPRVELCWKGEPGAEPLADGGRPGENTHATRTPDCP